MTMLKGSLPGLRHLRDYQMEWLRGDVVAGVVLAAYLLPAAIGDATLAGLTPEAGLYACLFGGLVFWLFCSSRHTAVTVTSAISLLVGSSLGELARGDASRYAALAAATALMMSALGLAAWLTRAGSLVSFISETVMTGFKTGVALHLASTQLPKLFGFKGSHGDFWERMGHFLSHLGETTSASLALGAAALALLILGKWLLPNRPVSLLVLVGGIAAVPLLGLQGRGVALLGEVPQGLPSPGLPGLHFSDVNELLPLAMACFLLAAVESVAIGRMFARKHGYRLDANQEFLALSAANLAAGLGRGLPISGGMSQSLVNEGGGARTPLSGLFASGVVLVVVLFLAGLLHDLPQPVLAAIVLMAVSGLFKPSELRRLWAFRRGEFAVAIAAILGVLGSGLLRGVLIGVVLSLVLVLKRGSRPRTTELGPVRGTDYFADVVRHPENERIPGVFVFRCESALLYFNTEHVRDGFFELLDARQDRVKLAIFFMGSSPGVDLAGAELLEELHHALRKRGIAFRLAEARGEVRETLRAAGFEEHCFRVVPIQPVATVISEWQASLSEPPASA
jgi:high affinity sulfate transporter 1